MCFNITLWKLRNGKVFQSHQLKLLFPHVYDGDMINL